MKISASRLRYATADDFGEKNDCFAVKRTTHACAISVYSVCPLRFFIIPIIVTKSKEGKGGVFFFKKKAGATLGLVQKTEKHCEI